MEDPILFNPDNRLLGSSTGDLSLYGGQSDPSIIVREARDDAPSSDSATAGPSPVLSSAAPSAGLDFGHSPFSAPLFSSTPDESFAGGLTHAFQSTGPSPVEAVAISEAAVPAPHGGGSPLPEIPHISALQGAAEDVGHSGLDALAQDGEAIGPLTVGGSGLAIPVVGSVGDVLTTASHVTDAIAPVLSTVDAGIAAVADTAEAVVAPVLDAATATLSAAVDGVSHSVDAVLQPVEGVANESVGTVTELAASVAAPVLDTAGAAVEDVGHIAAAALEPVADLGDTAVATVSPLVESAGEALSATVAPASDALHDLGGSDPVAGVATLVSLVSVTDMFDFHPADAPAADSAADPGLGLLDTLADADAGSLLGADHSDHGAADHGGDDHHPFGL